LRIFGQYAPGYAEGELFPHFSFLMKKQSTKPRVSFLYIFASILCFMKVYAICFLEIQSFFRPGGCGKNPSRADLLSPVFCLSAKKRQFIIG